MTLSFRKSTKEKSLLADKKAFYDALEKVSPAAVALLGEKIGYDIGQSAKRAKLSKEDTEELINDAVVITVGNIRKGTFPFVDSSPVAYAKGVGRKLIANRIRKQSPRSEELEHVHLESDFNPDKYLQDKERRSIVNTLLSRLGDTCQKLLKMRYFKQLRDKEIIELQLVPYSNVGSLRSKRSQCLKELERLAADAGIREMF